MTSEAEEPEAPEHASEPGASSGPKMTEETEEMQKREEPERPEQADEPEQGNEPGSSEPKRRPTQKEKTLRAFSAYLEVLDTAAFLKSWLAGPLASMDLTMQGFRLLVMLYRDGPTPMTEAARQMRFPRQNLEFVLRRLEQRGWVCRENVRTPAGTKRTPEEKKRRRTGLRRWAWQFSAIRLTAQGEKFVAQVFPRHAKVVKALMRALDGREQETLGEICRKLRKGHILKFMSEITHPDAWEDYYYEEGDSLRDSLQPDGNRRTRELAESRAVRKLKEAWEPTPPPEQEQPPEPVTEDEEREESRPWMQPGVRKQPIMTYQIQDWLEWEEREARRKEEEYKREHPEYADEHGSE